MLRQNQLGLGSVTRVVDLCIVSATWLASFWLRFYVPLVQVTKGFPAFSTYAAVTPLIAALWLLIFNAQGIYAPQMRRRGSSHVARLLKSHATALLCFVAISYIFNEYRYSRGVMICFGLTGGLGLVAGRYVLGAAYRSLRRNGFQGRSMVLVGEPPSLENLIARMSRFPEFDVTIAGVVVPDGCEERQVAGRSVLGRFGNVATVLRDTGARQVLITLTPQRWFDLEPILGMISDETVDIQIVPDVHQYVTLGCEVENLDGLPIVSLNDSPLRGWGGIVKRMTDLIMSAVGLIILSPLLALIAVAVKVSSRGPIFYSQERMGLDGRSFHMYKFRSMRVDAESTTGAVWATVGDDRRTPIGAFLRATSLDEFPQLWNVFVGDMSLVGPRPERPVFVKRFRHEISHYMLRHKVKTGITGWAQVNGWRGDTSLDERIRCDLDYIREWSYLLDLKILGLTLWKGFVNKNAY